MKLHLLFAALVLSASMTGCTSLARGGAAGITADSSDEDATEDEFGPIPVTARQQPTAVPGQMTVAWEDNGIPIRQLTGPGSAQELKVPESHPKKPPSRK